MSTVLPPALAGCAPSSWDITYHDAGRIALPNRYHASTGHLNHPALFIVWLGRESTASSPIRHSRVAVSPGLDPNLCCYIFLALRVNAPHLRLFPTPTIATYPTYPHTPTHTYIPSPTYLHTPTHIPIHSPTMSYPTSSLRVQFAPNTLAPPTERRSLRSPPPKSRPQPRPQHQHQPRPQYQHQPRPQQHQQPPRRQPHQGYGPGCKLISLREAQARPEIVYRAFASWF
ncbi:hypothetical protein C8Q78DRAFT_34643 [Trametes maxima]|nr:hypothetical protein C8Q78DRAFT_34643 [Trametes maxima]